MLNYLNSTQALIKYFQGYTIEMFESGDWCSVPKTLNWSEAQLTNFRVKPQVLTLKARLVFDGRVEVDYNKYPPSGYKEPQYNIEATFTDNVLTAVRFIP